MTEDNRMLQLERAWNDVTGGVAAVIHVRRGAARVDGKQVASIVLRLGGGQAAAVVRTRRSPAEVSDQRFEPLAGAEGPDGLALKAARAL